jgi:hypothetical protein
MKTVTSSPRPRYKRWGDRSVIGSPLLVAEPGDLGANGADVDEGHEKADAVDGLALPNAVDLVFDRASEASEGRDDESGHQQRGDGE